MGMKIKRLEVKGYKSLKDVVWEPGDLNVLIGPNGSGKSNLMRVLQLLAASANEGLVEHIANDGGIASVLWDGRASQIDLDVNLVKFNDDTQDDIDTQTELRYELNFAFQKRWNRFEIDSESLVFGHAPAVYSVENDNFLIFLDADDRRGKCRRQDGELITSGGTQGRESLLGVIGNRDSIDPIINDVSDFISKFRFYYDPDTGYGTAIRNPNITRYDNELDSDGKNLINFLHTQYSENPEFRNNINTAMKAAFGSEYEELIFSPAADQFIQMRLRWKSLEWQQPAAVLSDGILKYLYIVAALSNPNPPPLIALDEPETGLHPSMLPIIAELASSLKGKSQVIITTHSPELLSAFEEDDIPTTTVFEWHDGETHMRTLSGEDLDKWLKEYKLGEMFSSGSLEAI